MSHRSTWILDSGINFRPVIGTGCAQAVYSFIVIVHVYQYRHALSRLGRRRSWVGWNWTQFTLPWFLIGSPRMAQARSRFGRPHGFAWTRRTSHHTTYCFVAARLEYPKCRGRHRLRRTVLTLWYCASTRLSNNEPMIIAFRASSGLRRLILILVELCMDLQTLHRKEVLRCQDSKRGAKTKS